MKLLELATGIEPATFSLQVRRTTYCATPAFTRRGFVYGIEPLDFRGRKIVYHKLYVIDC